MVEIPGTLYVAASPLGNLGDISERLASVLRSVDVVAAEDTRRARKVLNHVGARPRVLSFHAHSPDNRLQHLLQQLGEGSTIAMLTDAGTPTISDPGGVLVAAAREIGAKVIVVPGPSAVTAALSVSGLPADRFTFLGFLPRKGAERRHRLEEISSSRWTVVLFEAAARLLKLLDDLIEACGPDREAVVARELTKLHEETRAGTLGDLKGYYGENPPRGEVTLVVRGVNQTQQPLDSQTIVDHARGLLARGSTRRDAAAELAKEFGLPRREVYRIVSEL